MALLEHRDHLASEAFHARAAHERADDLAVLLQIIHRTRQNRLKIARPARMQIRDQLAEILDHLRLDLFAQIIYIAVMRIECAAVDVRLADHVGYRDALKILLLHQPGQSLPQQLFRAPYALILLYCSCHFPSPPFRMRSAFFLSFSAECTLSNIFVIFVLLRTHYLYLPIVFVNLMYYTISRKEIRYNIYFPESWCFPCET